MGTHYTSPVDVFLILTRGEEVLLALRENTGYGDGQWNFPSGKLDDGEPVDAAVCREAWEEIGLKLTPEDLPAPRVLHIRSPEGQGRIGLFYPVELDAARFGEPVNAEPHKCGGLRWFPAERAPEETVPYTEQGWELWRSGKAFGAAGW
ncbi:NUDIX domain-containing protein [Phytomonospora sp. NPDC050363]|uniref:NUDIX domain-containing protein n=1 Tax=Phytomonospora sp. NPDC050363 TaxID=3155642 RepID=UPI0034054B56